MALEKRYKDAFSKSQKDQAVIFLKQNAIQSLQGNNQYVVAEIVDGDKLFEVSLSCHQKELKIKCQCSELAAKPCAHIWAVLLSVDRRGLLQDADKKGTKLFGTAAARKPIRKKELVSTGILSKKLLNTNLDSVDAEVCREILFVIHPAKSSWYKHLLLELYWRPIDKKGSLKEYFPEVDDKTLSLQDQEFLKLLRHFTGRQGHEAKVDNLSLCEGLFKRLVAHKKLYHRKIDDQYKLISIKEYCQGEIDWQFTSHSAGYTLKPLCLGESYLDFLFVADKLVILHGKIVILTQKSPQILFDYIFDKGGHIPTREVENFIESILIPAEINLEQLPGKLRCEREQGKPQAYLHVRTALFKFRDKEQLHADLFFNYGGKNLPEKDTRKEVTDFSNGKILSRNLIKEDELKERLKSLGWRFNEQSHKEEYGWKLLPVKLPEVVDVLLKENWLIVAEGKSYKAPVTFQLKLSTGEDWFELTGEALFGDEKIFFPELMKAASQGERYVQLGDGSFGVLPEEWLKNYTVLTQLGELFGDNLRFRKSQALIIENLLQKLLDGQKPSDFLKHDFQESLQTNAETTPQNFKGMLRPYQLQGLSWLKFLRKVSVGGILADDMGLGKTVQILALLASIKEEMNRPALLIVPRSLLFNWIDEARKFTPQLRVMEYGGPSRKLTISHFKNFHIIVTTYGTVRQDVEVLVQEHFDYCILDEAQAIRNRDSSTHKAIRLLKAENRLSLSGTPIENSLSDLISQFEFLNPGMIGQGKLQDFLQGDQRLSKETLNKLKSGFKPFILRRLKSQVAKDLPPKTEQIIYCHLDAKQKRLYDNMLKYYKQEMEKNEKEGKANIEYLGALTRLRQMSCHAALVSEEFIDVHSAKLEVLLNKLEEIISEGHKVLVFSQFTAFLSIISKEVQKRQWEYCYLDGKTKNRQTEVMKFQQSAIPLFLISLKAGGVGLNLTAADYVFIMDPWWNPAIESQAIDRAYRIGQNKHVIACKLISKGTVEEKVLKMQRMKKYMADSLIDESEMLARLTVADFKQLLD